MIRRTLCTFIVALAMPALAQTEGETWYDCANRWAPEDRATVCEGREVTLAFRRHVSVDAGANGGIRVEAWDRDDIQLRAVVYAQARTEAAARRLAEEVVLDTGDTLRAVVPRGQEGEWVSVSLRLMVPRPTDLTLATNNGGVEIQGVSGEVRFRVNNGGVTLSGLAGDVRGQTRNGALDVRLSGDRWAGAGLDARTTNGSVRLSVPAGYSAELDVGTRNGRLRLGFPVLVQGDVGHRLQTTLGQGGPPVRIATTNGFVAVDRGE